MRCSENWEIALFGSIFFVGHVAGNVFLAGYGDTIGRIPMIRLGQGITLICYVIIVFFTRSIVAIYALIFIIGLLSCWRLSLAYIYGLEIISEQNQNIAGSFFNLYDATVMIQSSIFLMYVSKNWIYLHSLFILLTLVSFISFCVIPESPKYLIQCQNYEEAMKSYNYIARFNQVPEKQLSPSKDRFHEQKKSDRSALKR